MELFLMRHAKSDWGQGGSDFDRPLNQRGVEAAEKMGQLLNEENLIPELVLCSAAKRAKETADRLIEGSHYEGMAFFSERLYLCDISDFVAVIKKHCKTENRILVIAHNPGTEGLIYHLTGEDKRVTTANIAQIELNINAWEDFDIATRGNLIGYWRPRAPQH